MKKPIFFLFLTLLIAVFTSGCESVFNPANRSNVFLLYNSVDNCTKAEVYNEDGDLKVIIPKHGVGDEKLSASVLDLRDETYRYVQSPQQQIDAMLSGSDDAVPRGCRDWGFDVIKVDLRDGVETYEEDINLRPPDYWERPENWKALPASMKAKIIASTEGGM